MDLHEMADQAMRLMERLPRNGPRQAALALSRGEIFLLSYLCAQGGAARPGEMSRATGTSSARIAAAVKGMARKGWVERRPDEGDHRRIWVVLTEAGRAHLARSRSEIQAHLAQVLEALGEEDAAACLRILKKIAALSAGE